MVTPLIAPPSGRGNQVGRLSSRSPNRAGKRSTPASRPSARSPVISRVLRNKCHVVGSSRPLRLRIFLFCASRQVRFRRIAQHIAAAPNGLDVVVAPGRREQSEVVLDAFSRHAADDRSAFIVNRKLDHFSRTIPTTPGNARAWRPELGSKLAKLRDPQVNVTMP